MDERMAEKEKTPEISGTFIARLGDLGLGNPEGIPSMYADASAAELQELAEQYTKRLIPVEDATALRCIDGRHTIKNADGSPAVSRLARVGGSASNFGTALNGDAAITATPAEDNSLEQRILQVDEFIASQTGYDRSAHLGGCGGANGEIADQIAINENPAIMNAVEAFMAIPAVREYFGVDFNRDIAEIAKHMSVANRLPGQATPILLVKKDFALAA